MAIKAETASAEPIVIEIDHAHVTVERSGGARTITVQQENAGSVTEISLNTSYLIRVVLRDAVEGQEKEIALTEDSATDPEVPVNIRIVGIDCTELRERIGELHRRLQAMKARIHMAPAPAIEIGEGLGIDPDSFWDDTNEVGHDGFEGFFQQPAVGRHRCERRRSCRNNSAKIR